MKSANATPLADPTTEREYLALALADPTVLNRAHVDVAAFSVPRHRALLEAMRDANERGVLGTPELLDSLARRKAPVTPAEVLDLTNSVPTLSPERAAARLLELHRAREMQQNIASALARVSEGDARAARTELERALVVGPGSATAWPDPVPLGRPEPPPFPTAVLPPWIGNFVREVARQTQTPEDMAAAFALGALATLAGGRVRVQAWEGWTEGTNLYLAVIMGPGNLKSPVFRRMIEPIEHIEESLRADASERVSNAKMQRQIAEKRATSLRDRASKVEDPAERAQLEREAVQAQRELDSMAPCVLPRLVCGDVTPEQLVTLLSEQHERLAMLSAESALFGHLAGRYSDAPAIEVFLSAHSGDRVHVDRRGRAEVLNRPALTIAIAVQPGVVAKAVSHEVLRDRGLMARFLFVTPSSRVGFRDLSRVPDEVPATVARAYQENLRILGGAMLALVEPALLTLGSDARAAFVAWRTETEPRRRERGRLGGPDLEGWAAKLDGVVLRLAALLHLAGGGFVRDAISPDCITRAITLAEYFAEHSRIVLAHSESESDRHARDVLVWLAERGALAFTRRDVHAAFRGRRELRSSDQVEALLVRLEELGWVRRAGDDAPKARRGRPSDGWLAHPRLRVFVDHHRIHKNPDAAT